MKSKELIEKAIRLSGEPKVVELLEQFLRANIVIKDLKFDLARFIDKNSMYEHAKGIYHKDGYKYVTDHFVMVSVKSEYDPKYEDKIISPKGEIINDKFPNWKNLTDRIGILSEVRLQQSTQEICGIVRENEVIAKAVGKKLIFVINHEETLTCYRLREFSLYLSFLKAYPNAATYMCDNQYLYANDGNNFFLSASEIYASDHLDDYMVVHLQQYGNQFKNVA